MKSRIIIYFFILVIIKFYCSYVDSYTTIDNYLTEIPV